MSISTRKATAADAAFAREAHHGAYRDVVVAQFGAWDERAQDEFFARGWRSAAFEMLLSEGQAIGYTAVEDRPGDVHVRELVIHPSFQNRGLGTAFLRSVMMRAGARGVPVRLGTFHRNRALALYRRLGFRDLGRTDSHVLLEWAPERGGPSGQ